VSLRRLNAVEYDNTLRDLLGTTRRPAQGFPADPIGFGYNNNADLQHLAPLQVELYVTAAEALIEEATAQGVPAFATAAKLEPCDLAAAGRPCLQKVVAAFARRAWRRPVASDELGRLMGLADARRLAGTDLLEQLRTVLAAVLTAPAFLFRIELDPDPRSAGVHPVGPYELASRLSYFLWSSMPDEPLLAAAEKGQLAGPREASQQVRRMLADPRGRSLLENFVMQWLSLNQLDDHEVDPALFPGFDRQMRDAMKAETVHFLGEFLQKDLPVPELLTARFSFLDDRLARHYGVPGGSPGAPSRVELAGEQRRGLLTHGSVLTRTSFPDRTSPVVRGTWVLTHLMCSPPPPPPADVPGLDEVKPGTMATGRALLEEHRKNPVCASCHAVIDPLGFGLENYDAVGRWRTMDQGAPVDASGVLPDGTAFTGTAQLAAILEKDPRVTRCLAENLLTFALGRGLDSAADRAAIDRVVIEAGPPQRATLRGLAIAAVLSPAFQLRRGALSASPAGGTP
jgi:hypothetical protein